MNIVMISDNRYPDGDAGAVRERVLADMLKSLGHTVYRIGRVCDNSNQGANLNHIFTIQDKGKTNKGNLMNLLLFNNRVYRTLIQTNAKINYDAIILTGLKASLVNRIKAYATKNNIQLVYNSVEMYSADQFKQGRFSRHYINNRLIAEHIIDKSFQVISISSFLDNYFRNKCINSVRIPFVLEETDIFEQEIINNKVEIAYVGRPSRRKDFLGEIIRGLADLNSNELKKVHLTIVGIGKSQTMEWFNISQDVIDYIGESVSFLGVLPRDKALEVLRRADFTILYRSTEDINAKAGFPTKVTESIFNGIPVITNYTSDIGLYIHDGINGIVIDGESNIPACIRRATQLSREELQQMKDEAIITAKTKLCSTAFMPQMESLFGNK